MKSKYNKICLEGTDLVGKSTTKTILNLLFPRDNVIDRCTEISNNIKVNTIIDVTKIYDVINSNKDSLFVVLLSNDDSLLINRLRQRINPDAFDSKCVAYNDLYIDVFSQFEARNLLRITVDKKTSALDIVSKILEKIVNDSYCSDDLLNPTVEGKSKKIYRIEGTNIAISSLIPSLYSFTHNRCDMVDGSDDLRLDFWNIFGPIINRDILDTFKFRCNYISQIKINNKRYAITLFEDYIPPIEVVWKNAHYGTMKHTLKGVENWPTRNGGPPIIPDGKYPNDIVRFDWRNPLPDKDEAIGEDFANFYVDVVIAKRTVIEATKMIRTFLRTKGYDLIDLCYFINESGKTIFSEITPDGMRIQKMGRSFDKDLWRMGKSKSELVEVWRELLKDLV